jgi:hypothetical protein
MLSALLNHKCIYCKYLQQLVSRQFARPRKTPTAELSEPCGGGMSSFGAKCAAPGERHAYGNWRRGRGDCDGSPIGGRSSVSKGSWRRPGSRGTTGPWWNSSPPGSPTKCGGRSRASPAVGRLCGSSPTASLSHSRRLAPGKTAREWVGATVAERHIETANLFQVGRSTTSLSRKSQIDL